MASRWFSLSSVGLFTFAIALQIQITVFSSADYIGLRIGLADLLIPLTGVLIAISLILKRSEWPVWGTPFGYWCIILLSAIFGLALMNGYRIQGELSHWAFLNKGVGWCVLMAYLAAGAWFARNFTPDDIHKCFTLPFLGFLALVTLGESILRIVIYTEANQTLGLFGLDFGYDMAGFMVNRNAFAFLYLSGLVLSSYFLLNTKSTSHFEGVIYRTLWVLLPLFLSLNLSRASLLILVPMAAYLLIRHARAFIVKILPLVVIGSLALPLVNFDRASFVLETVKGGADYVHTKTNRDLEQEAHVSYRGDSLRIQILKDSWALIKAHPLTGAGLGSTLKYQEDEDRDLTAVIDNTALWILTEMGPFGLLSFLAVFIAMLSALYKRREDSMFAAAMIFVLLGFAAFSLLHEILYSRFLWFFLGLALAVPKTHLRR